jgi:hypothetical protein
MPPSLPNACPRADVFLPADRMRPAGGERLRRGLAGVLREPLVQFLLAGGLVFLGYRLTAGPDAATGNADTIVISPSAADAAIRQRADQLGRSLTPVEREAAVRELADEEILVREAYRQGVDRQDAVIRSRLIDKMRLLIAAEPPAPGRRELEAYWKANASRYGKAGSLDAVLPRVKRDWVASQRETLWQRGMDELRKGYRVELPAGSAD